MALPKLYEPITWVNDSAPALNEDNLNAISQGLSDVDDRVISLAGTIMEDVPQIREDMEIIEAGLETVGQAVTDSQTAATSAAADKLVSEGWAKGTQNGSAVGSSSPYYHNNAEYFKDQARSFTPTGYQELVDDVDDLKEALTDEAETRAALGAHNLGKKYNGVSNIGITFKDAPDGGNYVNGTATGSGGRLNLKSDNFVLKAGTYSIVGESNDHSKYSSVVLQKTSDNSVLGSYSIINGTVDKSQATFTLAADTECYFGFNTSSGTAYGTDTFIIYPMVKLADDKDDTFYPYAMTNKELTEAKADKSDLASISITGTTNSTGATIAVGTYFYLNGALVKAKADIANGATLTANTNYVAVTAGGLNELPVLGNAIEITATESFANLKNGMTYKFSPPDTGSPFIGYNVAVKVAKVAATWGVQIAFKIVSSANTELDLLAIRPCLDGTYGDWRKFSGVISS